MTVGAPAAGCHGDGSGGLPYANRAQGGAVEDHRRLPLPLRRRRRGGRLGSLDHRHNRRESALSDSALSCHDRRVLFVAVLLLPHVVVRISLPPLLFFPCFFFLLDMLENDRREVFLLPDTKKSDQ